MLLADIGIAAILVDPAMAAACRNPQSSVLPPEENTSASARGASTAALLPGGGAAASGNNANGVTARKSTRSRPRIRRQASTGGDPGAADDEDIHFPARKTFILKDQNIYTSRASLWRAQDWNVKIELDAVEHESWPYLDGCATLMPLKFPHVGMGSHPSVIEFLQRDRDLVSPAEEMIFYWTNIAPKRLVQSTKSTSSNASYYLLKHVAQHWVNQLELINTTISKGEWFSDDYQAKIDDNLSLQKWKQDLKDVNSIAKDINYMRRHLNHFWRAMILNLERVGVTLGCEEISEDVPLALKGAQKDFITIHNRMQPLRERAEALNSVANDLANLRAAFRGVHDGEFSVRLSLFASIVFPLTLVAGIFSMSEDYLPGTPQHWKLWAIGLPVCLAVAMGLVYGKRPWRIFIDGYVYGRLQLRKRGLLLTAQEQQQWDSNKAEEEALKVNHHRRDVKVNARSETRVVRVAEDDLEGQAAAGARR
jgi:Mg2+ and Co2+ transporter CorA